MNKRGIRTAAAGFMVMLSILGAMSIMAEYGAADDPLVSKSYIDDVLTPEITKKIESELAKKRMETEKAVSDKLSAHLSAVDLKIAQLQGGGSAVDPQAVDKIATEVVNRLKAEGMTAAGGGFQVVQIPDGQTLIGSVGTEVILRSGTANCYSTGTVGIVDTSAGAELAPGKGLLTNHLYLISIEGKGVKGVKNATALVAGSYTVR